MPDNPGRRKFLAGLAGVTAAVAGGSVSIASGESVGAAQADRSSAAVRMFMYVGSFTGKDRGHGEGLSVYHRNRESDPWTLAQLRKDVGDQAYLIIDRSGRHLDWSHGEDTQV